MTEPLIILSDDKPTELDIPESAIELDPVEPQTFTPYPSFNEDEAPPPTKRRGRPKGSKNTKAVEVLPEPEVISFDFTIVLEGLNTLVKQFIGPGASISEVELSLITMGLNGLQKDVPRETMKRVSGGIYMTFLILGVALWGLRIYLELKKKEEDRIKASRIQQPLGVSEVSAPSPTPVSSQQPKAQPAQMDIPNSLLFDNSIT